MALTLLRKNNSDPISAYHDSLLWHSLLGSGVLDSAYDGFKGKASASSFSISSGLILYGGRLVEITKGTSIVLDTSELTSAVCYVYLSITISSDDSASTVSIYASSNSSLASSKTPVDVVGTFVMGAKFYGSETVGERLGAAVGLRAGVNGAVNDFDSMISKTIQA